jgi:hypothetical protein
MMKMSKAVSNRSTLTHVNVRRNGYELNPDANSGLNYKFANVVRNKRERAALSAEDCEECREVRLNSFICLRA